MSTPRNLSKLAENTDSSGVLGIASGGTGSSDAASAKASLGLHAVATSGSYTDLTNKPTTAQITENTNLYYTDARVRAAISASGNLSYNSSTGVFSYTTPTTSGILEGTNLYYTDSRARGAFSAGTGISYNSSTGVITSTITQYTDTLARGAVSASGSLAYNSSTGVFSYTTPSTTGITEGSNLYYTDARARAAISVTGSGSYNSTTGVITVTGGVTSVNTRTGAVSLTSSDVGLGSVENKSSATIRSEITSSNVTTALGYTPENSANRGVANGYASLNSSGQIPSSQLPSYVDDVLEAASLASFPVSGETGKIYVALDTNKTYRWSGSAYVYITSGAVDSVAGKTGVVLLTNADVGLGSVENKSSATIRGELTSSNVTTALGFTPYNSTNPSSYITTAQARSAISVTGSGSYDSNTGVITVTGGVTSVNSRTGAITIGSGDVTGALGFTPYNSSNPTGYITSSALSGYLTSATAASTYLPLAGGTLTGTLAVNGGNGVRIFVDGGASITSHLYFANAANNRAYNWQLDESSNAAMWGYGGSAWAKLLTVSSAGAFNSVGAITQAGNQVLHAGNYTSYSPSLGGSGASGTWGISITGSAAQLNGKASQDGVGANTIPTRDANGYTFLNYINSNTGNSENPGVSQVIVTNGGDNYYRKASIAHFTSAVQSNASGTWGISISGTAATATSAPNYLPLTGGTISGSVRINSQLAVGQNTNGTAIIDAFSAYAYYGCDSTSTAMRINVAGNATFPTDVRAPIFYDSNDTTYFTDPNNISSLYGIAVRGDQNSTDSRNQIFFWGAGDTTTSAIGFKANGGEFPSPTGQGDGYNTYLTMDTPGRGWVFRRGVGGSDFSAAETSGWITNNGIWQANASMRAPIFYDSNDTGYYVDPASTSNLYKFSDLTMSYNDMNVMSASSPYASRYGGSTQYRNGTMGYGTIDLTTIFSNWGSGFIDSWSSPGSAPGGSSHYVGLQGCHYNHQNSANVYGFQMVCAGEADNRFFWRSSWATPRSWVEMLHTGNINSVPGDLRAPIFYDRDNTGYYLDPNGSSYLYSLALSGAGYFRPNNWIQQDSSAGIYWPNHYGAHFYPNTTSTYTQLVIDGSKNGYSGMYVSHSGVNGMMYDGAGNGGVYREATGRWYWYYLVANDCLGIGTSSTSPTYSLYLNKGVYAQSRIDAPIYYDQQDTGYYVDPNSSSTLYRLYINNNVYFTNYGRGVVGVYDSYRYQAVFAMGDAYKMSDDGTSLSNMYGIGWSHPNAGGAAGNLTDHGMLIINNGSFRCAISNSIVASGNITAYSDERLKTNWQPMPDNYVTRLAKVKVGIYDRTDEKEMSQVGVSAQSFQQLLPQAIITAKDEMQTLSVSYGNAALASAVELAKEIVDLKTRVAELEALINKLILKD